MLVFKSAVRPRMIPLVKDPFEGRLRVALGRAKARRVAVSLARISEASAPPGDAPSLPETAPQEPIHGES